MGQSRQEQLDRCVEIVYDNFVNPLPHNYYITSQQVRMLVKDRFEVDRTEAANIATLFDDRYIRERPTKNGNLFNLEGIQRAAELGKDVPLDDDLQDEIIEFLHDAYLESPSKPLVNRDNLHAEVDGSETAIDLNLYVLKLRGWVETRTHSGVGDAGYHSAELTEATRSQL